MRFKSVFLFVISAICFCGYAEEKLQDMSIVISSNAPEVVKFAAAELKTYLNKISGKDIPIRVDVSKDEKGLLFLVGKSRLTEELKIKDNFEADAFIIKRTGNKIVLMGDDLDISKSEAFPFNYMTSHKGSLFAVYEFLEKYFGVRWFWPGESGELVPVQNAMNIPEKIDIEEKPDFLWRHIFIYGMPPEIKNKEVPLWYMRNKMGIDIGHSSSFAHSWSRYMSNEYFKEHPEYYGLIKGKRTPLRMKDGKYAFMGNQICTSNPEVVKIFVDKIRKSYKPDDKSIVSISPNDGLEFCECDKCKALDHPELYGTDEGHDGLVLSDRIFTFANEIAKEIKKTHPRLRLGIFSYTVLRPPPRTLGKIEDNIVISMTQINAFNSNEDCRKTGEKRIKEWSSKASAFIGREYWGDYNFSEIVHPHPRIIAENISFLKKNSYIGYYWESSADFGSNNLNYYLLAKLMWKTDAPLDKIMKDYLEKAYGKASGKMKEYFELMEESFNKSCRKNKIMFLKAGYLPELYSPEAIAKAYALLDDAEKLAESPEIKKRIEFNRAGLQLTDKMTVFLTLCRKLTDYGLPVRTPPYEAKSSADYSVDEIKNAIVQAKEKLKEIRTLFDKYGKTSAFQGIAFDKQNKMYRWSESIDEYFKMYVQKGNGEVMILPLKWKFNIDPDNKGEKADWYKSDFDDSSWKEISTDNFWEKQGYENYDGYAWYRLENIRIPEKYKGKKCTLIIGAVDESCTIYVNGSLAGSRIYNSEKDPDGWKKPVEFDITGNLRWNGMNCIAVKVHDSGGMGGIWKRIFLVFK
ncbi:MAG: hypothetical protein A2017_00530 [Lentisphaerae bacterium GWF2_44_16]|nr:MAG: hypothetical protein A2017_00530 [Lentisphaerae bacterium GWF2_44_16]